LAGGLNKRRNIGNDCTWGRLTPGLRAEYAHDFQGSSRAALGYSVLPYALGIEYQTSFGGSGARDHAFAMRLGAKF